jgi:hypothetical protein
MNIFINAVVTLWILSYHSEGPVFGLWNKWNSPVRNHSTLGEFIRDVLYSASPFVETNPTKATLPWPATFDFVEPKLLLWSNLLHVML